MQKNTRRQQMNQSKWIKKNINDLTGKNVVVTGATGGLGKELCFLLAKLGANITLACRNKSLADKLANELKTQYPTTLVDFVSLDLSSLDSVKTCINEFKKLDGIDVLVNNAGVYNVPLKKLDSGFNNIFTINFVHTYYLTKQLLPLLEKRQNSVCITLGSIAHNYSKIDETDIDFSSRKRASKIYGNSKRFLMFSMFELFKNSKVRLSVVHPGITLTNMTSHYPKAINWLVKFAVGLIFPSPKNACLNILYGTSHYTNKNEWVGPRGFDIWGKPKLKKLKTCKPQEYQKICEIADKVYKNIK